MQINTTMQTRSGKTYATNSSSSRGKNNIRLKMKVDNVDNSITLRMQTRSGKTYNFGKTNTTTSSSKEKNNIKLKMKVDNVDNRLTLRMQTRSGKTYSFGKTYTATTTSSSMEKNNIKLEMKVDNVKNVVNRTREPRPRPAPRPTSRPISTHRVPSGFVRPTKISDELAMFLGKPVGTEMARTDVSRHINSYIRTNNLQDPENGRTINPDPKLRALLKLGENDELTYFNLQKYMKHHFIRDDNVDNVENVVISPSFTQSTPSSNDRRPMGFIKPTKISDELATFLGKPVGTEMARTDVSRLINNYIRYNNLQDPQNGRKINPDAKLRSILTIEDNDELTYFNLQKYMRHHFIRDN